MSAPIRFLEARHVLKIHELQLGRFGGGAGLRDRGLLESAVAQPRVTFGGAYVHEGLLAMAAAYLFHLASNHPFVDGNKRVAVLSAIVFLDLNGVHLAWPSKDLEVLTLAVAAGAMDKRTATTELTRIAQARP